MPEAKVDEPSSAHQAMSRFWRVTRALRGGTYEMRRAALETSGNWLTPTSGKLTGQENLRPGPNRLDIDFLPREPAESEAAYNARLNRSFLFSAYGDTVSGLSNRPFTRDVVFEGPARLEPMGKDADLEGRDLTAFGRDLFLHGVDDGLCHVLVDHPPGAPGETLAEERLAGRRPFFVLVPSSAVLGWRSKRVAGVETLVQLRILEESVEPDGQYGEKVVRRVRIFERTLPGDEAALARAIADQADEDTLRTVATEGTTRWRLMERSADGKLWLEVESGTVSINQIPLVTYYTNRTAYLSGRPPLFDLAEKNIEHWQSSSDQRSILHVARVGIMFGSGITEEEANSYKEVGVNRLYWSGSEKADLRWVEHTGTAVGAGRQDLKDLEEQMIVLGLRPLVERTVGQTATQSSIGAAQESSDMKAWVRALEKALASAFVMADAYYGDSEGEPEITVDVDDDFGLSLRAAEHAAQVIALRTAREISREYALKRLRQLGVLDEDFDPEEDAAKLQEEGEALAELRTPVEDDDEGEEEPEDEDDDMGDHEPANGGA